MSPVLRPALVCLVMACSPSITPVGPPEADPCANQACSGQGTCAVVNGASPVCVCNAGFFAEGLSCNAVVAGAECDGVTCNGRGACVVLVGSPNTPRCTCDAESVSAGPTTCVPLVDPCAGITCSGHGTCAVAQGAALCSCDVGFDRAGPTACVLRAGADAGAPPDDAGTSPRCAASAVVLATGLQNRTLIAPQWPWLYVSTEGPLTNLSSPCFTRLGELLRVPLSGGLPQVMLVGVGGAARPVLVGRAGVLPSSTCSSQFGGQTYRIDTATGFATPASGLQDSTSATLDSQFLYAGVSNPSGVVVRGPLAVALPSAFSTRNAVVSSPMQVALGSLYFVGASAGGYELLSQATGTDGGTPDVLVNGIPNAASTPPLFVVDGTDVFIASRATSGYELRRASTSARNVAFSSLPALRTLSMAGYGSNSVQVLTTDEAFVYVRERETIVRVPRAGGTAMPWLLGEAAATPTDFALDEGCLTWVSTTGAFPTQTATIKRVRVSAAFPP